MSVILENNLFSFSSLNKCQSYRLARSAISFLNSAISTLEFTLSKKTSKGMINIIRSNLWFDFDVTRANKYDALFTGKIELRYMYTCSWMVNGVTDHSFLVVISDVCVVFPADLYILAVLILCHIVKFLCEFSSRFLVFHFPCSEYMYHNF